LRIQPKTIDGKNLVSYKDLSSGGATKTIYSTGSSGRTTVVPYLRLISSSSGTKTVSGKWIIVTQLSA